MTINDYGIVQYLNRRKNYKRKINRVFLYLEILSQWTVGEDAKNYREAEQFYARIIFDGNSKRGTS